MLAIEAMEMNNISLRRIWVTVPLYLRLAYICTGTTTNSRTTRCYLSLVAYTGV